MSQPLPSGEDATSGLTLSDWLSAGARTATFLAIALGVIAVVGTAGIPRQRRDADTVSASERCLAAAHEAYERRWERTCSELGLAQGCLLPLPIANSYSADRQQARAECRGR